jgi:hypothetical protein
VEERQADGGEYVLLVHVPLGGGDAEDIGLLEIDADHGHPVLIPADEEVDALFVHSVAVAQGAGDGGDDVGEADLDEDLAAALAELLEEIEVTRLGRVEHRLRSIDMREADGWAGWKDEIVHQENKYYNYYRVRLGQGNGAFGSNRVFFGGLTASRTKMNGLRRRAAGK